MAEKISARVRVELSATPEQVYDAWLNPAKARDWLATALRQMGLAGDLRAVEIDAWVGGRFLFSDLRGEVEARHWGTYFELERGRKIGFTWIVDESEEADPSRVTLTLEPEGEGCIATLEHEMDAAWAEYVARTEKAWTLMLEGAGVAPMNKEKITAALRNLVGTELRETGYAGNMRQWGFRNGTWLHLTGCPWRIVADGLLLMGSADYYARGKRKGSEKWEFGEPTGNLIQELVEDWLGIAGGHEVESVEADEYGGFALRFADGTRLEVFANGADLDHEYWRLLPADEGKRHFVVEGRGISSS